jgi:uncharacterized protein YneF (UPF0154 family)
MEFVVVTVIWGIINFVLGLVLGVRFASKKLQAMLKASK